MAKSKNPQRPFGVHFFTNPKKQWFAALHSVNKKELWKSSEGNGYTRIAGSVAVYASVRKMLGATLTIPAYRNGQRITLVEKNGKLLIAPYNSAVTTMK